MKLDDFKNTEPKLLLEDYFTGKSKAWGAFESIRGTIKKQFVVDIEGKWDGKTLELDEKFKFNDGRIDHRLWHITKSSSENYDGIAEGVVGKASGRVCGQAFQWKYKFRLQVGKRIILVSFDDWMFLQDQKTLINRAKIKKYGIVVGRIWLFFQRLD